MVITMLMGITMLMAMMLLWVVMCCGGDGVVGRKKDLRIFSTYKPFI